MCLPKAAHAILSGGLNGLWCVLGSRRVTGAVAFWASAATGSVRAILSSGLNGLWRVHRSWCELAVGSARLLQHWP